MKGRLYQVESCLSASGFRRGSIWQIEILSDEPTKRRFGVTLEFPVSTVLSLKFHVMICNINLYIVWGRCGEIFVSVSELEPEFQQAAALLQPDGLWQGLDAVSLPDTCHQC